MPKLFELAPESKVEPPQCGFSGAPGGRKTLPPCLRVLRHEAGDKRC